MRDDRVYRSQDLTAAEWRLVDQVKQTLKILARVIAHRNPQMVKHDIDPDGGMAEEALDELVKQHRTPDVPQLNAHEEAAVIGQRGPMIFARLMVLEE